MPVSIESFDSLREGFVGDAFRMQTQCPICNAKSYLLDTATNIHPSNPLVLDFLACRSCGHGWINPLPRQEFLNYLYGIGSHSVIGANWSSAAKHRFSIPEQMVLEEVAGRTPGRYLELGVGQALLYRRFGSMGWQSAGIEPGDWGATLPGVVKSLADLPADGQYDVVVAMDVIEHISDPVEMLRSLRALCAEESRLYAAFPNRKSWRGLIQKGRWRMVRPLGHLHFFSAQSAGLMFEAADFSITRLHSTDLLDRADVRGVKRRLAYLAQSMGWGDQLMVYARPRLIGKNRALR